MQTPVNIDWSALGFTPDEAPRRIGLRIAPSRVVADIAAGAIDDEGIFLRDARGRLVPAPSGLFDERVFGPLPRDEGGALRLEPDAYYDPREQPQSFRFGAFILPSPVVHPWVLRYAPEALVEAAGLEDEKELKKLLSGMLAVVQVQGDDGGFELVDTSGGEDPPDAVYGAEAIEKLAGDRLPDGSILWVLPMLPAGLRPVLLGENGGYTIHDITCLYRYLVPYQARWTRLTELNVPPLIMRNEAQSIAKATTAVLLDGLLKTGDEDQPYEPATLDEDEDEYDDEESDEGDDAESAEESAEESDEGNDEEGDDAEESDEGDAEESDADDLADPEPDVQPIAAFLRRGLKHDSKTLLRKLDETIAENPRLLSTMFPGEFHHLRAWLEASALELVPLREDGEVDEERLERTRIDRLAQRFSEAYGAILGIDFVWHPSHERPHADVYVTPPRKDGTRLLVTGGMSSAPTADVDDALASPYIELAVVAPARLGRQALERLAHDLVRLARYPSKHETSFAAGHSVRVERPIASNGGGRESLTAWILFGADGEPWSHLAAAVPRSPRYLVAVGVTEAELKLRMRDGLPAVEALLRKGLRMVTDPERASLL